LGVRPPGVRFVAFGFHAAFVHADDLCRRLSFADRHDEFAEHYFIMDRSEESPDEAVPGMGNVYIERDDQGWGGYGGIERVVLTRDSLNSIRVSFEVSDSAFCALRLVLDLIMRGYEAKLEVVA
jgi:hypothetical protein